MASTSFVPCAAIPYPLMPNKAAERAKTKAREAMRRSRRTSWTEVLPKSAWEGGLDDEDDGEDDGEVDADEAALGVRFVSFGPGYGITAAPEDVGVGVGAGAGVGGTLQGIDEEDGDFADGLPPVRFDAGYSVGGDAKSLDANGKVRFFADTRAKTTTRSRLRSIPVAVTPTGGTPRSREGSGASVGIDVEAASDCSTPSFYSDSSFDASSSPLAAPGSTMTKKRGSISISNTAPTASARRPSQTIPASILLNRTNFSVDSLKKVPSTATAAGTAGLRRPAKIAKKVGVKPDGKVLRVQMIGGREILVESAYKGNAAPYDYDLEKGSAVPAHGEVADGAN